MPKSFYKFGNLEKRLNKHSRIDKKTKCWIWTGANSSNKVSYGSIKWKGKTYKVHRISASLFKKFNLKSKLLVCHHCDNSLCWNPDHLFIGTQLDNIVDMTKKGRRKDHHGQENGRSKLKDKDVLMIRKIGKKKTAKELSDNFNVSIDTIYSILRKESWKNL